jgi:hypothetical protein
MKNAPLPAGLKTETVPLAWCILNTILIIITHR